MRSADWDRRWPDMGWNRRDSAGTTGLVELAAGGCCRCCCIDCTLVVAVVDVVVVAVAGAVVRALRQSSLNSRSARRVVDTAGVWRDQRA